MTCLLSMTGAWWFREKQTTGRMVQGKAGWSWTGTGKKYSHGLEFCDQNWIEEIVTHKLQIPNYASILAFIGLTCQKNPLKYHTFPFLKIKPKNFTHLQFCHFLHFFLHKLKITSKTILWTVNENSDLKKRSSSKSRQLIQIRKRIMYLLSGPTKRVADSTT